MNYQIIFFSYHHIPSSELVLCRVQTNSFRQYSNVQILKLKKKSKIKKKILNNNFLKHTTSVKGIKYSRILLKRKFCYIRLIYSVTAAQVNQLKKKVLKNYSFKLKFRNICTFLPLGFDLYQKMDKVHPQKGTNQAWAQKKPTTLPPLDPFGHQGNTPRTLGPGILNPVNIGQTRHGPKKIPSHCPPRSSIFWYKTNKYPQNNFFVL